MNRYQTTFSCKCPINNVRVNYELEIATDAVISVEELLDHIEEMYASGFHELIADDLCAKFGGHQVLKAFHHGVNITTTRGKELK
jgi:hypothetical protein